jgi:hypothetical protein
VYLVCTVLVEGVLTGYSCLMLQVTVKVDALRRLMRDNKLWYTRVALVNKLAYTPPNLVREQHFLILRQILDPEKGVWSDEMAYVPGKVGQVLAYIQIQNYTLHDVNYLP